MGQTTVTFKGLEVDYRPRPKQGLAVEFEKLAVGVFVYGPRAICLGLSTEEIKAKLSPSSSSYRESDETEDEEVEEGDDIVNISKAMSPHSGSKPKCKEIEKIEGDSLSKKVQVAGLSFLYLPFLLFFEPRSFNGGSLRSRGAF